MKTKKQHRHYALTNAGWLPLARSLFHIPEHSQSSLSLSVTGEKLCCAHIVPQTTKAQRAQPDSKEVESRRILRDFVRQTLLKK
jgi:hypothetical protein